MYDERRENVQRERVDHGLEVHEHGEKGLTREAEAELARKREQIAREHSSTRDESVTQTSARTATDVQTRVHKVEEVVPVLERDIYRPHEIVHDKRVLNVSSLMRTNRLHRRACSIDLYAPHPLFLLCV